MLTSFGGCFVSSRIDCQSSGRMVSPCKEPCLALIQLVSLAAGSWTWGQRKPCPLSSFLSMFTLLFTHMVIYKFNTVLCSSIWYQCFPTMHTCQHSWFPQVAPDFPPLPQLDSWFTMTIKKLPIFHIYTLMYNKFYCTPGALLTLII